MTTKAEVHFTDQFFNKDDPTKASLELAPFLFPGLGRQELDEADLSVTALSQGTTNAASNTLPTARDWRCANAVAALQS
ncbi:hypothetical protein IMZ48_46760 [Candidatus Bathyarchaeota archaeon]|nr:hypothetical protein [Candidatus Bathyarchaeota archaeon]